MKMLSRTILLTAGLACLVVTPKLHAQLLALNAKWTLQKQDYTNSTYINGVYNDKVAKFRVTTQDLLNLLADSYPSNFPSGFPYGAQLVLADYDHFEVDAADGSILVTNASPFLTYADTYAQTNYLYLGEEDAVTEKQHYIYTFQATIQFDDPAQGINFTFDAIGQEKYSQTAPDRYGLRKYQDAVSMNGLGTGMDADGFLVLSGKATSSKARWVDY